MISIFFSEIHIRLKKGVLLIFFGSLHEKEFLGGHDVDNSMDEHP